MRHFGFSAIGVASGAVEMFSAFEDGGAMWTGEGPRVERRRVHFERPFREAPVVQVGLGMWDIASGANQRADIAAQHVTPEGFELQFRTWGDTRVARVRANWLAIGPVAHADDWIIED
ncbi:H-type lectin domain-containing protein [Paracoccus sp. (in: a-proteobacteria)]|uniref:H-type lectin domain-containing protein n=1 Tax=Paracoccus sp. TaxID=267 RepID=UPI00321FC168